MSKENKIIVNAIKFLETAPYRERKPYMPDYMGDGVEMNGYIIQKETWNWLIWKPTNIGEQPQFKGESLVKVVPNTIAISDISKVLKVQPWTYI